MTKIRLWIAAAALVTAAAGSAQAQTKIPPPAKDFAMMAAQSDQYEIQAGRTAAVQAVDPRVRAFARRMVEDHGRTSQAVKQAAQASGLPPPPEAMSADQAHLLMTLQSLTGPDFDRAYVKQQVLAHDQALAVEGSYATGGSDPNLRRAAQAATPLIQHHLEMAQQLRAAVGGS